MISIRLVKSMVDRLHLNIYWQVHGAPDELVHVQIKDESLQARSPRIWRHQLLGVPGLQVAAEVLLLKSWPRMWFESLIQRLGSGSEYKCQHYCYGGNLQKGGRKVAKCMGSILSRSAGND